MKRLTKSKIIKSSMLIIVSVVFGVFIMFLNGWGHVFNRNHREISRRVECKANIKNIMTILSERGVGCLSRDSGQIESIINEMSRRCASEKMRYKNGDGKGYFLIFAKHELIVSEDARNHDTTGMAFTDLPYTRHSIVCIDGEWKLKVESNNR